MEQCRGILGVAFFFVRAFGDTQWYHIPGFSAWFFGDHDHSHAVFVELTFGINSVLAVYGELRRHVRRKAAMEIDTFVEALTARQNENPVITVSRIIEEVNTMMEGCDREQSRLSVLGTRFAIICACAAAALLYFDAVGVISWGCIILILPLPYYWISSHVNYRPCRKFCRTKAAGLEGFIRDFVSQVPNNAEGPTDGSNH